MNKPVELKNVPAVPLWIDGRQKQASSARAGDITNPATGQVTRRVPFCNAADIDAAVQAASRAFPGWRDTPPLRRARILMKFRELLDANKDELAKLITAEHGKTLADAAGSVQRGVEVVEFAMGIPHLVKGEYSEEVGTGVDCHSVRQPLGVCAGITPFNFPVMVPLWMFPVALACGNTFVLKPSEKVPSASMLMAELLKQAGLPDGVFNVVHGDKDAVDALLNHPGVKAISFVGSTPIAKYIYETAAKNGKRVQALGGAKNHAVVLPDADFEFAADALIGAAYGSAGERCMAISAVVAVGESADPLIAKLKDKASKLKIGAGDSKVDGKEMDMGPLVTCAHRDKVAGYVDKGVAEGAKLVLDGRTHKSAGDGFFLGASLFDNVTPDMTIYKDEIFGPVLIVLRVKTLDEAIRLINANQYANGTAVFTRSGGAARKFEREIEVGMVGVNVPIPVPIAFYSFGGWRNSLFGDQHVHGMEGVRFYTRGKVITTRWPDANALPAGFNMPTLGANVAPAGLALSAYRLSPIACRIKLSARENILARIRAAQGRSGAPHPQERAAVAAHLATHPEGPRPGFTSDAIAGFSACAAKLTTSVDQVATMAEVPQAVARYLEENNLPKNAVCWPELFELEWQAAGIEIDARAAEGTDPVGITSAFCAIAETGTLLTLSGPRTPATTSLLPETHIAVVRTGRMVRSMEDAWKLLRDEQGANFMPRAANFISGPSRTADIEQTLVLGAHGPYRVHIVLVG